MHSLLHKCDLKEMHNLLTSFDMKQGIKPGLQDLYPTFNLYVSISHCMAQDMILFGTLKFCLTIFLFLFHVFFVFVSHFLINELIS